MPRPPKSHHPLRDVRLATQHSSQREFASFIGVSPATIQALEQGKLRLTATLAQRISDLTGCADAELLKGAQGKAKTRDGRPYAEQDYEAWQDQMGKNLGHRAGEGGNVDAGELETLLQMILKAAMRCGGAAGVQAARALVTDGFEKARQKLHLTDALEEMLQPWQNATTISGTAAEWKSKKPNHTSQLGAPLAISWKQVRKLTIGWQCTPTWAGGLPVQERQAGNLELFPAGYIVVAVGGAGCRMALDFWLGLAREHGINEKNGQALHQQPGGNWQAFFRAVPQQDGSLRYVPRAAFLDLDPAVPSEISAQHHNFFHSASFFTASHGAGNLFVGPNSQEGAKLVADASQFLARYCDDIGAPAGALLLHSLEGGTGAGIGSWMLREIRSRWPSIAAMVAAPLPLRKVSHVVVSPYNCLLAIQEIQANGAGVLMLDNELLAALGRKYWGYPEEEMAGINQMAASILQAVTAPLRFASPSTLPLNLRDWMDQMADGQRSRLLFACGIVFPLQRTAPHGKRIDVSIRDAAAVAVELLDAQLDQPTQLTLLFRGHEAIAPPATKARKASATAIATAPRLKLRLRTDVRLHEATICLGEFAELRASLRHILTQGEKLLSRGAYLHAYEREGITPQRMQESLEGLRQLINGEAPPSLNS